MFRVIYISGVKIIHRLLSYFNLMMFCTILSLHVGPHLIGFRDRGRKIHSDDNKPSLHKQNSNDFFSRSHVNMRKYGEQIHRAAVFTSLIKTSKKKKFVSCHSLKKKSRVGRSDFFFFQNHTKLVRTKFCVIKYQIEL